MAGDSDSERRMSPSVRSVKKPNHDDEAMIEELSEIVNESDLSIDFADLVQAQNLFLPQKEKTSVPVLMRHHDDFDLKSQLLIKAIQNVENE